MVATAPVIDVEACKPADIKPHGIVLVRNLGFASSTATCSCGWVGRRRRLKAAAKQDAWTHSILERCAVACPLVITW
jgi:hypothetical protein